MVYYMHAVEYNLLGPRAMSNAMNDEIGMIVVDGWETKHNKWWKERVVSRRRSIIFGRCGNK